MPKERMPIDLVEQGVEELNNERTGEAADALNEAIRKGDVSSKMLSVLGLSGSKASRNPGGRGHARLGVGHR